ncbi:hypothetical protein GUITHDRAFT_144017 [Guillardia theta CCMP2712]|uniref:IPT/TIG domain-containing protein n=1 Tax=Guillardia theta (strain CCMP2712) TaxID=905079 RepID=L1IRZ0_GUITC|nr:hypothetical protein GUITHDRAFT_144017 [Guillardia theta CCMP2712]EKX38837.1 hypothetical protein GUITHDRAFT_144017 [Guillardia theta CCMP2712]|eukprot:XP_005825817.1 hypothetical protein GUITHDRAFT_144017 [Guillardia theta CCMP2712]
MYFTSRRAGNITLQLGGQSRDEGTSNGLRYEYMSADRGIPAVAEHVAMSQKNVSLEAVITPSFGRLEGGTRISVVGMGESPGANAVARWLHVNSSRPCGRVPQEGAGSREGVLVCISPEARAPGSAYVAITAEEGTATAQEGFLFLYEPGASVSSIRPSRGGDGVEPGEKHCIHFWMSSTLVACVVQGAHCRSESCNVTIEVSNNGVDFSEAARARFEYRGSEIGRLEPSWGLAGRATEVRVTLGYRAWEGAETGDRLCRFGDVVVSGVTASDTGGGTTEACTTKRSEQALSTLRAFRS